MATGVATAAAALGGAEGFLVTHRTLKMGAENETLRARAVRTLYDMRDPVVVGSWRSINDVVMGGCSTGGLMPGEDCAIFKGVLSTRNNGGFSSIRSPQTDMDLSDSDGILINCKGDGRLYKLQVCADARSPGVKYQAEFAPSSEWNEHAVLWSDLKPSMRGVLLEGAPEVSRGEISSFGILTSKVTSDGGYNSQFQPGEFALAIRSISAFQLE
mmetsp:Transcript_28884/g.93132  ORF Transcript_28884/g.93132 Transcript_28884/m.93132 type:complete len:214 (-) Transcript_28884:690-1331(-)